MSRMSLTDMSTTIEENLRKALLAVDVNENFTEAVMRFHVDS